jgi:hypothetical protein
MDINQILKNIKKNPLDSLIKNLSKKDKESILRSDVQLFEEQYSFYFLTCKRLLKEMSLGRRFRNGLYYALKYRSAYSENDKKLAKKFHETKYYFDVDFANFLIHSRILMDRTISLSKYFLSGKNLPSFDSFNKHKKFFLKHENIPYDGNEEYANYVRENTGWFDDILKFARDDVVVHAKRGWMKHFGLADFGAREINMYIIIPDKEKKLAKVEFKSISVIELIKEVGAFLHFFSGCSRHKKIS